jgi:hypothetical protein
MRPTTLLFAIIIASICLTSCTVPIRSLESATYASKIFETTGISPVQIQDPTLPIVLVLDMPQRDFQAQFVKALSDSLLQRGFKSEIEVYSPLSFKLLEDELPRIKQIKTPYLWITSERELHHQAIEGFGNTFNYHRYNIRLYDQSKIVWRAQSYVSSFSANDLTSYIMAILRNDGVLPRTKSRLEQ